MNKILKDQNGHIANPIIPRYGKMGQPIGSIYMSINNINPSVFFGGTWERIAKGRTLVGVDENDADFNVSEKIGGSKYIQDHTHTKKSMGWSGDADSFWIGDGNTTTIKFGTDNSQTGGPNVVTGNSGNLQPYFTCYIWCRIA